MNLMRKLVTSIDFPASIGAGLAAGAAFYATMLIDLKLTGRNVDDRIFLAGPLTDSPEAAKRLGTVIHVANSVAFACLYSAVEPIIPGPPWFKGTLFFNLENVVLYPLTAVGDRHPSIRNGDIEPYWTWPAFVQSIPRHVAYGATLGIVYAKLHNGGGLGPTTID